MLENRKRYRSYGKKGLNDISRTTYVIGSYITTNPKISIVTSNFTPKGYKIPCIWKIKNQDSFVSNSV
jgi:hypothetical protein